MDISTLNSSIGGDSGESSARKAGRGADEYWMGRLSGDTERVVLPFDLPPRASPAFHYAKVSRPIEARLGAALLQLVRRENASSVDEIWCAAIAATMHRYDPGVGRAIRIGRAALGPTSRPRCEDPIADLVLGFIASTRIAEISFHENFSFRDALRAMIASSSTAPISTSTLEKLARRDLTEFRPAIPVAFGSYRPSLVTAAGCDLAFFIEPAGSQLTLQYNTFRFSRNGALRILGHVFQLLTAAIEAPDDPLWRLPLLTESESDLLAGWIKTGSDYAADRCLHQLFEDQVSQRHDTTALVLDNDDIKFGSLDDRAEGIASRLAIAGVGRGTLVAIAVERGFDFVASLLGVWKVGAIAVPIELRLAPERIDAILLDSRPAVLLRDASAPPVSHDFLKSIDLAQIPAPKSGTEWRPAITPDEIALILYAAGASSGPPTGVMISHRALVNQFGWLWRDHPIKMGEIGSARAGAGSVDFVLEIFGPLLAGVPVMIFDHETTRDSRAFLDALTASRVTRVISPVHVLEDVIREREAAGAEAPDLKLWIVTGGALRVQTARRFHTLFGSATLLNAYGAPETAGFATTRDSQQLLSGASHVSAGVPLANMRVRVVDRHDLDMPLSVPGEIWLGGDSLARGYLHRPDLTIEVFPTQVFSDRPELRWFRTGDVGRLLPDGNLELLGSIDETIEIGGLVAHRGEIEREIRAHPAVERAVVRPVRLAGGGTKIIGYVTPVLASRPPRESDLREFLRDRLPRPLIPGQFVAVDDFPRNPDEKIDWARLPEPSARAEPPQIAPGRARPELEQQIAAVWGELLGGMPASYDVSLAELGGDIETTLALAIALARHNRYRVSIQNLLDHPTIRRLAGFLEQRHDSEASWTPIVKLRTSGSGAPLFLVHDIGPGSLGAYQRIAAKLDSDRPVYALTSRGLSGFGEFADVPSMARQYLTDLRAVYPKGPCFLGGFYFGGRVALEMARQLLSMNEKTPLVVLLDSHPHAGRGLLSGFGRGRPSDPGPPADAADVFEVEAVAGRLAKLIKQQTEISGRFADGSYDGKIALLKPKASPIIGPATPGYGWSKLVTGGVETVVIPEEGDLRRRPEAIAAQLGNLLKIHEPT